MNIPELIKLLPTHFFSSLIKEPFLHRLVPSTEDTEKIADYLLNIRKKLCENQASILEQKLALLKVPYLKHLELSQIDHWEKNYEDDLNLLFNLYIAQGVMHKGLRRIIWEESSTTYFYINSFAKKQKNICNNQVLKLVKNKMTLWKISFLFLLSALLIMNSHTIFKYIETFALIVIGLMAFLILFTTYRDQIVAEATEKIINKYPDLIIGYENDIDM